MDRSRLVTGSISNLSSFAISLASCRESIRSGRSGGVSRWHCARVIVFIDTHRISKRVCAGVSSRTVSDNEFSSDSVRSVDRGAVGDASAGTDGVGVEITGGIEWTNCVFGDTQRRGRRRA